jgi:hypothetical protein
MSWRRAPSRAVVRALANNLFGRMRSADFVWEPLSSVVDVSGVGAGNGTRGACAPQLRFRRGGLPRHHLRHAEMEDDGGVAFFGSFAWFQAQGAIGHLERARVVAKLWKDDNEPSADPLFCQTPVNRVKRRLSVKRSPPPFDQCGTHGGRRLRPAGYLRGAAGSSTQRELLLRARESSRG